MGEGEKEEAEKVVVEKMEEKGESSTEKGCHTHPEKDWKLRRPLLVKTNVHLQCRSLQGGSVMKKSAG